MCPAVSSRICSYLCECAFSYSILWLVKHCSLSFSFSYSYSFGLQATHNTHTHKDTLSHTHMQSGQAKLGQLSSTSCILGQLWPLGSISSCCWLKETVRKRGEEDSRGCGYQPHTTYARPGAVCGADSQSPPLRSTSNIITSIFTDIVVCMKCCPLSPPPPPLLAWLVNWTCFKGKLKRKMLLKSFSPPRSK